MHVGKTVGQHVPLLRRRGFLGSAREGCTVSPAIVEPHLATIVNCIAERFGETAGR